MKNHFQILILGAGTGGTSVAARLTQQIEASSIAIVEPNPLHYYQPFWTLVGAGVVPKEITAKPQAELIPKGVAWIQKSASEVRPKDNKVILHDGSEISYDYLLIATGLKMNWSSIEGLEGNLGKNGICTIYEYEGAQKTKEAIESFKGGDAYFIMPPVPIKCAGAPQKIMYIFDDILRKKGKREGSRIHFVTNGVAMFGIPLFAEALDRLRKEKEINVLFNHKLVKIDAINKKATFSQTELNGEVVTKEVHFEFLHVVPTQSAHEYISASGLAHEFGEQKGWLEVDKYSFRHVKYSNIYGIGDVAGTPNSKTGAAIRVQAPGVTKNILRAIKGQEPEAFYNGYSSCPLITEIGKVMLAEFGYDGKLLPTFPLDPSVPRWSYWLLKRYILPPLYWYGMLKGKV